MIDLVPTDPHDQVRMALLDRMSQPLWPDPRDKHSVVVEEFDPRQQPLRLVPTIVVLLGFVAVVIVALKVLP